MEEKIDISRFLDESGKITQMPSKSIPRRAILEYLAGKFEPGMTYTERQVNGICDEWHTFGDFFLLRRELVDSGLMGRERNGSRYWRTEASPESETNETISQA